MEVIHWSDPTKPDHEYTYPDFLVINEKNPDGVPLINGYVANARVYLDDLDMVQYVQTAVSLLELKNPGALKTAIHTQGKRSEAILMENLRLLGITLE